HVADHFREPEQAAVVPSHRGDHHARPEQGPVLPDAPALLLEPARPGGHFQLPLRLSRANFFLAIEAGEVLADDLVRAVALEPARARVPAGDQPLRIEHENRAILHVLDHEPEPLLALPQPLDGLAPPGQIAGYLDETDQ